MRRWVFAATAVVVLSLMISGAWGYFWTNSTPWVHDPKAYERNRQIREEYERVSLIRLLAAPHEYDGHKVEVGGFVTLQFEGNGLHLDKDAYEMGLRKNAVWIDAGWLTASQIEDNHLRYGEVAGTFVASPQGHGGLYAGTLTQVRRIRPTVTLAEVKRERAQQKIVYMLGSVLSAPFLILTGWAGLALLWLLKRRRALG